MNGKQLKNSILQWAIQGKLVPQDPNDEPASVLLERIRAEKARLVKEKKIKKGKNESIIYRGEDNSYYEKFLATGEVKCIDDEIPFEIPKSWEWCRLKDICTIFTGATFKKEEAATIREGVRILRGGNILPFELSIKDDDIFLTKDKVKEDILLKENDILTPAVTSLENIGKMVRVDNDMPDTTVGGFVFIIRLHLINQWFSKYILYLLSSPLMIDFMKSITNKSGQAFYNIGKERLSTALLPIPPLKEQKRIVQRIESILPKVHQYEELSDELASINIAIHSKLKKSILQEAIQGKLVSQIKEEGTAEELLADIRSEKERLVKKGKLKKSALIDSVIYKSDDNKYYERINGQTIEIELPYEYTTSWSILRLKDVCQLIDGEKKTGKGICLDAKYLRGKSSATIVEKGQFVYTGDNIILVDGENSGEVFLVPQDGYMGSTFKQLWLSSVMWKPYVLAFILFYKEELRNSKRGAAIPHLNKELFYNLPIGIPPLAEQQRITERVNELSQLLK